MAASSIATPTKRSSFTTILTDKKIWRPAKAGRLFSYQIAEVFPSAFHFFLNIMEYQYTGFIISQVDITKLNSFKEIALIFAIVLVITFANWSVTTLFDGKGNMKEIFMMICYCLYPLIWSTSIGIILSNILTEDEMAVYTLVNVLGVVLLAYMFFFGIISIHEYGLVQCLLTILFTVVAVLIVLFAFLLFFDLFQRMYGFVYTIYREISLRELLW